jgi:hypothetical protein
MAMRGELFTPLLAPGNPGIGAAVLGISGRVHAQHYDRGVRAAAGGLH